MVDIRPADGADVLAGLLDAAAYRELTDA
jgi:hypothetical protein